MKRGRFSLLPKAAPVIWGVLLTAAGAGTCPAPPSEAPETMEAFTNAARLREDRLREITRVEDDICASTDRQLERIFRYQRLIADRSIDRDIRDRYRNFAAQCEDRRKALLQTQNLLQAMRREVAADWMQLHHARQFSRDLIAEGSPESAHSSLVVRNRIEKAERAIAALQRFKLTETEPAPDIPGAGKMPAAPIP